MRVLVLATVAFVTIKWLLIPIRTEGSSMLPTYGSNRLNFVNRFAYSGSKPARGDVVAIRLAGPRVLYVKRIVGLPGERVAVRAGTVFINDKPLAEPYVKHRRPWEVPEVILDEREYFVIGDNRGMSSADHDFGRVYLDRILGKVLF